VDNIITENGHDALHLSLYHPILNPITLVWGDIKNSVAQRCMSPNLKEKQLLCGKVFAEHKKEIAKLLLLCEEDIRGILAMRCHNG
jgi:hypothetical protein